VISHCTPALITSDAHAEQPPALGLVPGPHTTPHVPALHVATLPAGAGHAWQEAPHADGPSGTHVPPQRFVPAPQASPQAPAVHVAVAPAGAGHGVQEVPQVAGSSSDAHIPPHTW
jgi:hypothetical protein